MNDIRHKIDMEDLFAALGEMKGRTQVPVAAEQVIWKPREDIEDDAEDGEEP